jgi:predicted CoA-substrate-specific enzyme activase
MLSIGLDLGLSSVKAVLLENQRIIAHKILLYEDESETTARKILNLLLAEAGLNFDDIDSIVSTGVGRKEAPFAKINRSEQICLAKGAYHLFPSVRTVLETGAGGCRAMSLGDQGKLIDFASNSKCAGGTGSFIEAASKVLQLDLEALDKLALKAESTAHVTSYCAVFAESEIISNIHRGFPIDNICAGICESVMQRMMDVLRRVATQKDVLLCGGVATYQTIVKMFDSELGFPVLVPEDPQVIGALGAALVSRDLAKK